MLKGLAKYDKQNAKHSRVRTQLRSRKEIGLDGELDPAGTSSQAILETVIEHKRIGRGLSAIEQSREDELAQVKEAQKHEIQTESEQSRVVFVVIAH